MTARTATTKPADDKPFDFNLDAVQAETDLTPWRVHWQGQRWEFKHAEDLDVWELAAAADANDVGSTIAVLRIALGDQWKAFEKLAMPQYKLKALFEAYRAYCGMAEGEEPASSDS